MCDYDRAMCSLISRFSVKLIFRLLSQFFIFVSPLSFPSSSLFAGLRQIYFRCFYFRFAFHFCVCVSADTMAESRAHHGHGTFSVHRVRLTRPAVPQVAPSGRRDIGLNGHSWSHLTQGSDGCIRGDVVGLGALAVATPPSGFGTRACRAQGCIRPVSHHRRVCPRRVPRRGWRRRCQRSRESVGLDFSSTNPIQQPLALSPLRSSNPLRRLSRSRPQPSKPVVFRRPSRCFDSPTGVSFGTHQRTSYSLRTRGRLASSHAPPSLASPRVRTLFSGCPSSSVRFPSSSFPLVCVYSRGPRAPATPLPCRYAASRARYGRGPYAPWHTGVCSSGDQNH